MIKSHRHFLAICFACLLPYAAFSDVPVVDDSENFAMLDEQQGAMEQPVAREQTYGNDDEEPALATDIADSNDSSENAILLEKLKGMQQEVQELRGQLEVQLHEVKQLKDQQIALYKDLDARIIGKNADVKKPATATLAINSPTPLPVTPHAIKAPAHQPISKLARANPAGEQISYLAAYELVKNKQYDDALAAMETFVLNYPQGGYTANAQYWLGELYMVKKDYPQAIVHFDTVLQQFPSSSKSAASLLKIGYALAASGKLEEAKSRLQDVVKHYPDTNTSQLATIKLESLD